MSITGAVSPENFTVRASTPGRPLPPRTVPHGAGDLSRQPTLPYLVLAERPPVGPNKTGAT